MTSLSQDDNATLRTWCPEGANGKLEKRTDIMPHHEVLLRLDAIDLERGLSSFCNAMLINDVLKLVLDRSQNCRP